MQGHFSFLVKGHKNCIGDCCSLVKIDWQLLFNLPTTLQNVLCYEIGLIRQYNIHIFDKNIFEKENCIEHFINEFFLIK